MLHPHVPGSPKKLLGRSEQCCMANIYACARGWGVAVRICRKFLGYCFFTLFSSVGEKGRNTDWRREGHSTSPYGRSPLPPAGTVDLNVCCVWIMCPAWVYAKQFEPHANEGSSSSMQISRALPASGLSALTFIFYRFHLQEAFETMSQLFQIILLLLAS